MLRNPTMLHLKSSPMHRYIHLAFVTLLFALPTLLPGAERRKEPSVRGETSVSASAAAPQVLRLTVEGQEAPLGLDETAPRLGWQIADNGIDLRQTGYRILVASHPDTLRAGRGDLWDSGAVQSAQSQWVPYGGKRLQPNQHCYWQVRVVTNHGTTPWSAPAQWSVGLLGESHWRGQWIGCDRAFAWDDETLHSRLSARYLRKTFALRHTVRRATLHIAGLGFYEAYLNGQRIGTQVLAPAPTDYRRSVIYNTYDVTALLPARVVEQPDTPFPPRQRTATVQEPAATRVCLAVTLGNGRFYTMRQHYKPYKITQFGYPKLRANLIIEYTDGSRETIVTDGSWKLTTAGPIRSNNEYDGETYDATREALMAGWMLPDYVDDYWQDAERVAAPQGDLVGNLTPSMQVVDRLPARTVAPTTADDADLTPTGRGRYLIDFGQNFAGRVRMRVAGKGQRGDTLRLRFAERLTPDGHLYTDNLRDAEATDYYICSGSDTGTWVPRFVTHGFRYAEVTNYPNATTADFIGEVVSDPMRPLGTFTCADTVLNAVVRNARWGILSNYKGMPVDCPQRNERMPWLGDRATGCLGESYLMDNHALYAKWLDDIEQAQRSDGVIPDVAPAFWNYYSDNVSWPSVFIFAAEMLYQQHGDLRPIERHYAAMKRWLDHFDAEKQNRDGLITADKYGDWCVPPEELQLIHSQDPTRTTDGALIASAYYYHLTQLMSTFAERLAAQASPTEAAAYRADRAQWATRRQQLRDAFNHTYLHVAKGTSPAPRHLLYPDSIYYANNSLTANLLPLAFDLVPHEYRDAVNRQVLHTLLLKPNEGHLSCGVIGIQWLMRELSRMGRTDVAYLLATQTTYPSWGYMVQQGATTIWELWNGDTASPRMNSGNHVMLLGDLLPWCFEHVGGIKALEPGYSRLQLAPDFDLTELPEAKVSYESPYGLIVSNWRRTDARLEWEVVVPGNTTAQLLFPTNAIINQVQGLPASARKKGGKKAVYSVTVGSGTYHLSVPLRPEGTVAGIEASERRGIEADEFLYTSAPFPSCHAATLAEVTGGDLLCAFFGGTREGHPDVCLWTCRKRRLADGSWQEGWSAPTLVQDGLISDSLHTPTCQASDGHDPTRKACYNPVLYQVPGGDLLLFFKVGRNVQDWTGYVMRSGDGGRTWSQRERLAPATADLPADSLLGAIKNKPERVQGRIIAPSSKEAGGWRCYMELSDDDGAHWRLAGPIPQDADVRTIQPTLLRHKDGRLQMLCRTRSGCTGTSWSRDNGETWSHLELLRDLPNNNSGIDAVTLPNGTFMLVYNDFSTVEGPDKPLRNPLCVATSRDGVHWQHRATLEASPISQYSYPCAIVGSDGTVHIAYTWRRQRIKYVRLKP